MPGPSVSRLYFFLSCLPSHAIDLCPMIILKFIFNRQKVYSPCTLPKPLKSSMDLTHSHFFASPSACIAAWLSYRSGLCKRFTATVGFHWLLLLSFPIWSYQMTALFGVGKFHRHLDPHSTGCRYIVGIKFYHHFRWHSELSFIKGSISLHYRHCLWEL